MWGFNAICTVWRPSCTVHIIKDIFCATLLLFVHVSDILSICYLTLYYLCSSSILTCILSKSCLGYVACFLTSYLWYEGLINSDSLLEFHSDWFRSLFSRKGWSYAFFCMGTMRRISWNAGNLSHWRFHEICRFVLSLGIPFFFFAIQVSSIWRVKTVLCLYPTNIICVKPKSPYNQLIYKCTCMYEFQNRKLEDFFLSL
jgi:hypothetical protein